MKYVFLYHSVYNKHGAEAEMEFVQSEGVKIRLVMDLMKLCDNFSASQLL